MDFQFDGALVKTSSSPNATAPQAARIWDRSHIQIRFWCRTCKSVRFIGIMIVLGLALPSLKTEIHTGSYWHTSIEHLAQLVPSYRSYLGWDHVFRVKQKKLRFSANTKINTSQKRLFSRVLNPQPVCALLEQQHFVSFLFWYFGALQRHLAPVFDDVRVRQKQSQASAWKPKGQPSSECSSSFIHWPHGWKKVQVKPFLLKQKETKMRAWIFW